MVIFVVALVAVALGSVAQTVAGFGFALICGPLLITVLGQSDGLRLVITLATLVSVAMLVPTWRQASLRNGLLLAAPGIVLTPGLAWLMQGLDRSVLTVAAGATTLLAAGALAVGLSLQWLRGTKGVLVAGATSGAMNVLGGMSGPVAALYAVNARWPAETVRPTLQVFGIALNLVALASVGGPLLDGGAMAALAAGWAIGMLVARRLPPARMRQIVLALAALGGMIAVVRGLTA
ncbi:TSUP family transporter [Pseudonocardia sp. TRM90224]|uniref:TSUP family transporter n=1 Tax=Pseudonocardia sp. TRM90224 TaxID=2812678 RepID=UPI001E3B956E|nr:TSUP family transporter [Pseudonocardia sp. TRM90224]